MFAFEVGYVAVDVSEFLFDDAQTIGYEPGGRFGHFGFVVDPFFIVDVYEGVEKIVGTLDADVFDREVNDCGIVIGEVFREPGFVGFDSVRDAVAEDFDRVSESFGVSGTRIDCDRTE